MTIAVRFDNITKRFGHDLALDGFSLTIPENEVFALVGRNEAGKTTALRILLGLTRATSGNVIWSDGISRKHIGFVPEEPRQYDWMTAHEYLTMSAGLAGIAEHEHAVQRIMDFAHLSKDSTKIGELSLEEHVYLGIAHALIGDPEILILDEPTSTLDPVGQIEVLNMIDSLRGSMTIIIATHILEDAVAVADTIAIVEAGRMVITGTKEQLWERADLPRQIEVEVTGRQDDILRDIAQDSWIESVEINDETLVIHSRNYAEAWERIPEIVLDHNVGLKRLELMEPSYDDVFVRLTGASI